MRDRYVTQVWNSVARFAYTLLYTLLMPLIVARLWWRGRANPAYRQRIAERFGYLPHHPRAGGLWVHAVSVGETLAAAPLVKRFLEQNPDTPLIITTTTPTGSEQVKRLFGGRVFHMYLPYDLPVFIHRFLRTIRPAALVVMETELWPNLMACCEQRHIPVILANARLSEKSARGYAKFSALTQPMLQRLSVVAAQHQSDADRFLALGLPPERLAVTGSVKFDLTVAEGLNDKGAELRQQWGHERPVLALASSHPGEDEQVLDLWPELHKAVPELLLLLIPRHPERFEAVGNAARSRQLKIQRRSQGQASEATQVYVADTMGEMLTLLAAADVVLMGGSLVELGGHNPIEPAALGKATLIGPNYVNFAAIVDELAAAGAMKVCTTAADLQNDIIRLLKDTHAREAMGQKGLEVVNSNRGAVGQLLALVNEQLSG
jgi:3-deoxy-D-manno-octulosonic-acid transferase